MTSKKEVKGCMFAFKLSLQTSAEVSINMGVTNPCSFLRNIPSLCDEAAVYSTLTDGTQRAAVAHWSVTVMLLAAEYVM